MGGSIREALKLYRLKRYEAALNELLALDSADLPSSPDDEAPERIEYAYYLGLCYARLEKYDNALIYLEQVVTAASDPVRIYQSRLALAYIYSVTNRSRLAEFELAKLIESGFRSAQVYSTMAYALYMQGKTEEGIGYYAKALEIDAENATALNSLGFILADEGKDLKKALTFCRKAVDKRPNNPAYLDSLGWAYFRLERTSEAREYLKRALELAPGREEIIAHMKAVLASGSGPGPAGTRTGESAGNGRGDA
jgi:tetratricopeptide (TPR) repeat protein